MSKPEFFVDEFSRVCARLDGHETVICRATDDHQAFQITNALEFAVRKGFDYQVKTKSWSDARHERRAAPIRASLQASPACVPADTDHAPELDPENTAPAPRFPEGIEK